MTTHTHKTKDGADMVTKDDVREYFRALTCRPFDDSPGRVPGSVETVLGNLREDENGIYDSVSEYFFDTAREYLSLADVLLEIRNYIEDYIGDLQETADLIPA